MHSNVSVGSLESGMRNVLDENELERAMADIDKAKARSREQRIRSFCNAAALGNEDWLARLLKSGIKINDADANGRTALMLATCAGHLDVSVYVYLCMCTQVHKRLQTEESYFFH